MKVKVRILSNYNEELFNALIDLVKSVVDENGNVSEVVTTSIGTTIAGDFVVGKTYVGELTEETTVETTE